jgi:hypothetical protein
MNNEKVLEFIKADWEAKKRAFDAALSSPFAQPGQFLFLDVFPSLQIPQILPPFFPPTEPVGPRPTTD